MDYSLHKILLSRGRGLVGRKRRNFELYYKSSDAVINVQKPLTLLCSESYRDKGNITLISKKKGQVAFCILAP
jgi:hypothetical protein